MRLVWISRERSRKTLRLAPSSRRRLTVPARQLALRPTNHAQEPCHKRPNGRGSQLTVQFIQHRFPGFKRKCLRVNIAGAPTPRPCSTSRPCSLSCRKWFQVQVCSAIVTNNFWLCEIDLPLNLVLTLRISVAHYIGKLRPATDRACCNFFLEGFDPGQLWPQQTKITMAWR